MTFYCGNASLIGGWRFSQNHLLALAPYLSFAGISGIGAASGSGLRFGASLSYQYDAAALITRVELNYASGSFSQTAGSMQAGGIFPAALLGLKF